MSIVNAVDQQIRHSDFLELKKRLQPLFDETTFATQTDACLKRFLRAFGDVDEAYTALVKYLRWREEFGVDYLSNDEDIEDDVASGKVKVLECPDISGRPIILVTARLHNVRNRDLDILTKFIIYNLEMAIRRCNEDVIDNLCITFDLKEFSLNNMDYGFVKQLIWLLSRRYPERLGKCLIVNSPYVFSGCWMLIKLWLSEVTANKIIFIRDKEHLAEFVSPDAMPSLF